MAAQRYIEDLLWLVAGGTTPVGDFDSSQPAVCLPRRVPAARGCSFQAFDPTALPSGANGAIKGSLAVSASNAPVRNSALVEPAFWVLLPDLTLDVGGADALPSIQQILFATTGWVQLAWTPNGSSGRLAGRFDGPRP